jgi:hypothetical protein
MGSYISVGKNRTFLLDELSNEALLCEYDGSRLPLDPRRTAYMTHESLSIPVGGDKRVVLMVAQQDISAGLEACRHAGVRVHYSDGAIALVQAVTKYETGAALFSAEEEDL